MATALNGTVQIHYEDQGSGVAVLLVHGHTLDHRVWDAVATALADAGRRVIRPDLRGHGTSSLPDRGYHHSHHASDMWAVMESAAVEQVSLVGYSVGGGVALEMALSRPERLRELVLVSPVLPDRPFEPAFLDNLKEVAKTVRGEGVRAAMEGPWMNSPLFSSSLQNSDIKEKLRTIVRDFPGAEYLAKERDRIERQWTIPERLSEIAMPVSVLVGELEMDGFRAYAEEAASGIPGAELRVIIGCGHLLPLEAPGEIVKAVLRT